MSKKDRRGRPRIITPEVLQKLEDAFMMGLSDRKACVYADIGQQTLYDYIKRNPHFSERKEELKTRPDIKAQMTVVSQLGDAVHAWRWLERKDPDFRETKKLEHSGTIQTGPRPLIIMSAEEEEILKQLVAARRRRIEATAEQLLRPDGKKVFTQLP